MNSKAKGYNSVTPRIIELKLVAAVVADKAKVATPSAAATTTATAASSPTTPPKCV